MSIAINNKENLDVQKIISSKKQSLWIAMGSMVMFFGGLLSALIIEKADINNWQAFVLPNSFTYSTIIIVFSSLLFLFYKKRLKQNKSVFWLLFSIFICGIGFTFLQMQGWQYLLNQDIKFVGPKWNKGGGFLYVLTLMHMLHLFGGMIAIANCSLTFCCAPRNFAYCASQSNQLHVIIKNPADLRSIAV